MLFITVAILSISILYATIIVDNKLFNDLGLIGIFLASLFSHMTIFGRDLFTPAFLQMTVNHNPFFLGLAGGLGGAIGEIFAYFWGLGIGNVLKNGSDERFVRWVDKYGLLAILLLAASPLPDAPFILIAGSTRLSMKKVFLVEVLGKCCWYSVAALIGGPLILGLGSFVDKLALAIITVSGSFLFCLIFYHKKFRDWIFEKIYR